MKMVDIIDVKAMVKKGLLRSYVKDGIIYLSNEVGETVQIGEVKEEPKEGAI